MSYYADPDSDRTPRESFRYLESVESLVARDRRRATPPATIPAPTAGGSADHDETPGPA